MEIQQTKFLSAEKPRVNRRQAAKEKKLALLQDVLPSQLIFHFNSENSFHFCLELLKFSD